MAAALVGFSMAAAAHIHHTFHLTIYTEQHCWWPLLLWPLLLLFSSKSRQQPPRRQAGPAAWAGQMAAATDFVPAANAA